MDFLGVFLNRNGPEALYAQLYRYLVGEIRAGGIPAGEKLPGKRSAAAQLGVSVNTVDEAYQMLAAEGYVAARPRSGFVVERLARRLVPPPAAAPPHKGEETEDGAPPAWRYSFSTGGLDLGLFPHKTWNRLFREVLAGGPGLFGRGDAAGEEVLLEAIAAYLRGYRGVKCGAGQLVVGAGLEVLLGMLGRLLAGRRFAMEDPGYPKTGRVLANMGLSVCHVPVDEEGMAPALLAQSGATVAYLTPSHQFPTGGVMPVGRRTRLLEWAAAGGNWVVEDDYDSEFRFDGRPLPCLQGLDEAGRVVYAGTFSRSLAPGLRAAYLVLPPPLMSAWRAAYGDYACTVSRPEQHTLARLMSEGHFARSLNRMRAAYCARRNQLIKALEAELPAGAYTLENTHTGLYFLLRLPGHSALHTAEKARRAGLFVRALAEYRQGQGEAAEALVLGYGGLAEADMAPAARELAGLL